MIDHALAYAARGWRVFPVYEIRADGTCACGRECGKNAGKHPRITGGSHAATVDPAQITEWWRRWPAANIAIATGPESNLVVLDVDTAEAHGGKNGVQSLVDLEATHGALPPTYTVRTPTGGYHLYFAYPAGHRIVSVGSRLGIGLDQRGDAGYVLAPPSTHRAGGTYALEDASPPAELPAWTVERAASPAKAPTTATAPTRPATADEVTKARGLLARILDRIRAVPPGAGTGRDDLNRLAFAAGGLWPLPEDGVFAALYGVVRAEWADWYDPPEEAERIIRAALDAGAGAPIDLEGDVDEAARAMLGELLRPGTTIELASRIGEFHEHYVTGFPTFDEAVRGGLATARLLVVGGAPEAGKTTFAVNLAWRLARFLPVVVLAADEEPEGLLVRVGEMCGIGQDALERGEPGARAALVDALHAVPHAFEIIDGSRVTIEQAVEVLSAHGPGVLVVDSIQTALSAGAFRAADDMGAINANTAACKTAARAGHLVIATSELSRAAYRNADQAAEIDMLSAFRGSGRIEHAAKIALVLRSVKDGNGLVDVTIAKNRGGRGKPSFTIALDLVHATFHEARPATAPIGLGPPPGKLSDRILAVVRKAMRPMSGNQIARLVHARREAVSGEVERMIGTGELVIAGNGVAAGLSAE